MYKVFKDTDGSWCVVNPTANDTLCRCKDESDANFIAFRLNLCEDLASRALEIRSVLDRPLKLNSED